MSKKKPAQFKRFSDAMSKIVRVSKDELAKRELADKRRRAASKRPSGSPPSIDSSSAHPDEK